jgi:hypothetical protein
MTPSKGKKGKKTQKSTRQLLTRPKTTNKDIRN